jgi:predicted transcriptional regulator
MLVSQILKHKGDTVFTVTPQETIAEVAALLHSRRVGALVVMEAGAVAGIVSERDLVRALAGQGASALQQPVSSCMTADVLFADPGETIDSLLARMTDRRIRHLPVCVVPAAGGHRLDRRPGEVEDRRGPGRGRRPEGLYRHGLGRQPASRSRSPAPERAASASV